MSMSKTGVKVKDGHYGEDLAKDKASSDSIDPTPKRHGYSCPPTGEKGGHEVQGPLECIGGGSADAPSFKLYSGGSVKRTLPGD